MKMKLLKKLKKKRNNMNIAVIIGSTRQGRVTPRMAKWMAQILEAKHAKVKILDLSDYDLEFFNEELPPQNNPDRKAAPNVQKWLDDVADADGVVIVSPEYNKSVPGVLKNALDYLDFQLKHKPVLIATHGGTGGTQAVVALRSIISGVLGVSLAQPVTFVGRVADSIDEQGNLDSVISAKERGPHISADSAADELLWYAKALSQKM